MISLKHRRTSLKTQHFSMTSEEFMELSCYLTKQRHILLEEGYVEEHGKVVEERELREERKKSDNPVPIPSSRGYKS